MSIQLLHCEWHHMFLLYYNLTDVCPPCLQLKDLQDKYSQCEDMLCEAREDIKNLRNKSLPNSTVQRYTALASVLPMDSLAAEIEGTFRKGLDTPAPSEYK